MPPGFASGGQQQLRRLVDLSQQPRAFARRDGSNSQARFARARFRLRQSLWSRAWSVVRGACRSAGYAVRMRVAPLMYSCMHMCARKSFDKICERDNGYAQYVHICYISMKLDVFL